MLVCSRRIHKALSNPRGDIAKLNRLVLLQGVRSGVENQLSISDNQ